MKDRDMDFVYAEMPHSGHGFPPEVAQEMWEFFRLRRLAVAPRRQSKGRFSISERPFSSFMAKPGKEERKYLGRLGGGKSASAPVQLKSLIKDLRAGGGLAKNAVAKLGELKTPRAARAVAKVLGSGKQPEDVRRFAAQALGAIGDRAGLKALRKAVTQEEVAVVVAAFESLARIPESGNVAAFRKGVGKLSEAFDAKKSGKRMSYSDFDEFLKGAGRIVGAMAASGDRAISPLLDKAARDLLLVPLEVRRSERAGHCPAQVRRRFAQDLLDAYERLADVRSRPVLELLAGRSELGVTDRVKKLLQRLE
jgi:hypothetical protein